MKTVCNNRANSQCSRNVSYCCYLLGKPWYSVCGQRCVPVDRPCQRGPNQTWAYSVPGTCPFSSPAGFSRCCVLCSNCLLSFLSGSNFWKLMQERACLPVQTMWETRARSRGREDPLEEGTATHSSILAWRTPWTEEPGQLQSLELQRVRHDWSDLAHTHFCI